MEKAKIHKVDVYTTDGHFTVLVGSQKEGKFLASMLFDHAKVYKVKVFTDIPGAPANINCNDGRLILELV